VDHLFRSKGDTAQAEADAARFGVILEAHHLAPRNHHLWAELWPAVLLFMRCQTQWRATSGGVLGLDYGVLLQLAPVYGVTVDAAMMDDIQAMELHAREQLNRRR
jgi:hypothetical protein